jgi:hypothetical protein
MWRSAAVFSRGSWIAMVALMGIVPASGAAADADSAGSPPVNSWPETGAPEPHDPTRGYESAPPEILSGNELISLSKKHGYDLASTLVAGERVREIAQRERDLIRLSCIEGHLLQMKLVKRIADDALAALGRPVIQRDELHLRHEFRSVEMGTERVAELYTELTECAGSETPILPESEGKPNGPGDPTAVRVNAALPERPASASPYM